MMFLMYIAVLIRAIVMRFKPLPHELSYDAKFNYNNQKVGVKMSMLQCENCAKWTDNLEMIRWPFFNDGLATTESYFICDECHNHLADLRDKGADLPEIGSSAAQPDQSVDYPF